LRVGYLVRIQIRQLPNLPADVRGPLWATEERSLAERLEGLEQDMDALMEFFASALPEEVKRMKPEEWRRVYGMLRLEISARPDGTLEAHRTLGEDLQVGFENGRVVYALELAPSCVADWRMQRNILRYRRPSPREPPP
jgi:hypothetical protein